MGDGGVFCAAGRWVCLAAVWQAVGKAEGVGGGGIARVKAGFNKLPPPDDTDTKPATGNMAAAS